MSTSPAVSSPGSPAQSRVGIGSSPDRGWCPHSTVEAMRRALTMIGVLVAALVVVGAAIVAGST